MGARQPGKTAGRALQGQSREDMTLEKMLL